jgi:hypothetical protein
LLRRRNLLVSGGLAVLAAPFERIAKSGAEPAIAKRFVSMCTPCGLMDAWLPSGDGRDFVLSEQAKSLASVREKLLIVQGMRSALTIDNMGFGGHPFGIMGAFAGHAPWKSYDTEHPDAKPRGYSIDRAIAATLGDQAGTPLALGVLPTGDKRTILSFGADGSHIRPEGNASKVFQSLFRDLGLSEAELARLRTMRKSVLDAWVSEVNALQPHLGQQHRATVDGYLTQVRALERDLTKGDGAACNPTAIAGEPDFYTNAVNVPEIGRQMMDLVVSAFACGASRVASLMWNQAQSNLRHPWVNVDSGHHGLTHSDDVEKADAQLVRIYTWFTEQFAYLVKQLDSLPDLAGGSLLDSTVVYWTQPLGKHRSHSGYDMRVIMAGSAGGYLGTGRYLKLAGQPQNDLLSELHLAVTGAPTTLFDESFFKTKNELQVLRA